MTLQGGCDVQPRARSRCGTSAKVGSAWRMRVNSVRARGTSPARSYKSARAYHCLRWCSWALPRLVVRSLEQSDGRGKLSLVGERARHHDAPVGDDARVGRGFPQLVPELGHRRPPMEGAVAVGQHRVEVGRSREETELLELLGGLAVLAEPVERQAVELTHAGCRGASRASGSRRRRASPKRSLLVGAPRVRESLLQLRALFRPCCFLEVRDHVGRQVLEGRFAVGVAVDRLRPRAATLDRPPRLVP